MREKFYKRHDREYAFGRVDSLGRRSGRAGTLVNCREAQVSAVNASGPGSELVHSLREDQRARWLLGERRMIESYLERHPELSHDESHLLDFIYAEYCVREELGDEPKVTEYLIRFPHLAEQLEPVLALHHAIEMVGESDSSQECPNYASVSDVALASDEKLNGTGFPTIRGGIARLLESQRLIAAECTEEATVVWTKGNDRRNRDEEKKALSVEHRDHKRLGKFELLEICGQGAFGTVFKALDASIGRIVALKVPRTGRLVSQEDEDRFLREARAVAQLRDQHIVAVFEAGRIDGTPYIASEFVEGLTLAEVLKRGRVSQKEAVGIVRQIALALQVAHDHGVIHRDIKPANVMLELEGQVSDTGAISASANKFVTRLMDFGLARRDAHESYATVEGQILGTPAYMSPEQARGDSRLVDGRSDVFGLGALFYELLAGESPFRGNVRMVLQQVLLSDPKPVRQIDDSVPLDLQTICLKCLEKDPAQRYSTAGALADDLSRFERGFPVTARPISAFEKCVRLCRRHRLVTSLSAAIATALVLGVVGTTWQLVAARRAERARTHSQLNLLQDAPPVAVPALLDELQAYSDQVLPEVRRNLADPHFNERRRIRLQLFLSTRESTEAKPLFDAMLRAPFSEALLIRNEIAWKESDFANRAREEFRRGNNNPQAALRAASYLAGVEHSSQDWLQDQEAMLTKMMIDEVLMHTDDYGAVEQAFSPIGSKLQPSLEQVFRDPSRIESQRRIATSLLLAYAKSDSTKLLQFTLDAEAWQLPIVLNSLSREQRTEMVGTVRRMVTESTSFDDEQFAAVAPTQLANAALALVWWEDTKTARAILKERSDRSARSHFIDRYRKTGLNPEPVVEWAAKEADPFAVSALILILGSFSPDEFSPPALAKAMALTDRIFSDVPSAGAWAAAAWSRRMWNHDPKESNLASYQRWLPASQTIDRWMHAPNGHVLVIQQPGPLPIKPGVRVLIDGSRASEPRPHSVTRRFAISMFETTIDQYRAFAPNWRSGKKSAEDGDSPVYSISGQKAAEYCNWLSAQSNIPPHEWCYVSSKEHPPFLEAAPNMLDRRGFRLPTETEWEYACRAGSSSNWHFGVTDDLLINYAWCPRNSLRGKKCPVGLKMPNDAGLFDLYGNADEICDDDPDREYPLQPGGYFVTRGGAAGDLISPGSRGGNLGFNDASQPGALATGFRICRTVFVDDMDVSAPAAISE
jgi:serine/threonine protein kinase